ncbi:hypothetical protein CJ97_gp20 [Ralstonia phage RSB2]|uniref:Uncharacterized protein ORF20 n=1 Tax=Ralstonia phage RSB2 TaxID=913183 RepID=E5RV00_9CAUD|nr:hypothetical protein CJ97_gp20 [Ralstonia phage RSB2]BAJ51808.1 hypothetical protein [Ralstonia phage RSB2]
MGDEVAFAGAQHCAIHIGKIIKINPKTVRIEYERAPKYIRTVDRHHGEGKADFVKVGA